MYDGLSHLYSDCDSRLRSVPLTNYKEKSRGGENAGTAVENEKSANKSPERMSSPHRMSDIELKEKEAGGGVIKKIVGTGKEKGHSKQNRSSRQPLLAFLVHITCVALTFYFFLALHCRFFRGIVFLFLFLLGGNILANKGK